MDSESPAGDLTGVLVVSIEQAVAGPYCTRRLADAGARVIKLERNEGDFARTYDASVHGLSSYFVWLNFGKESVRFDIKDPNDIDWLHRMLANADVFVQNLAPGATERATIGSATLRERYPRLITCDITGYGSSGPYRDMKAYDLLVQAESGLANLTGSPAEPGRVGVSVCDIACGMTAYEEILLALYSREKTGRGRGVEASLFHSVADWMNVPYLMYRYGEVTTRRLGLHHPSIAPYGAYTCSDGAILLAVQNEREWQRFCSGVLGDPSVAADPRFGSVIDRVHNREALDERIGETVNTLTCDDLIGRLKTAEIAYGRLSTIADLVKHPQMRRITVDVDDTEVEIIAPPIGPGRRRRFGAVPSLGENTAAVRAEFGASTIGNTGARRKMED